MIETPLLTCASERQNLDKKHALPFISILHTSLSKLTRSLQACHSMRRVYAIFAPIVAATACSALHPALADTACTGATSFVMQIGKMHGINTVNGIRMSGYLAADTKIAAEGVRQLCKPGQMVILPDVNPDLVAELCDFAKSVIVLHAHGVDQNDAVVCSLR